MINILLIIVSILGFVLNMLDIHISHMEMTVVTSISLFFIGMSNLFYQKKYIFNTINLVLLFVLIFYMGFLFEERLGPKIGSLICLIMYYIDYFIEELCGIKCKYIPLAILITCLAIHINNLTSNNTIIPTIVTVSMVLLSILMMKRNESTNILRQSN